MGAFWDLIQEEVDRNRDPRFKPPSERDLAKLFEVSPTTIGNWRNGLRRLPDEKNIRKVADFVGRVYEDVLLIALAESGYATGTQLAARIGQPKGRQRRKELGKVGEESQDPDDHPGT